jgi:hypothetical protein
MKLLLAPSTHSSSLPRELSERYGDVERHFYGLQFKSFFAQVRRAALKTFLPAPQLSLIAAL